MWTAILSAGFDPHRIAEVHGSIHWQQCTRPCGAGLFPAAAAQVTVDEQTMRTRPPLPSCPACGALARPNILMFSDAHWDEARTALQLARMNSWLHQAEGQRFVIIECGAGSAIPTVRRTSETLAISPGVRLVRINPREPAVPAGHISLALGALEALRAMDQWLTG